MSFGQEDDDWYRFGTTTSESKLGESIVLKCTFEINKPMDAIEIKTNFHHLIDKISNEELLIKLYHIMEQAIISNDGQLWSRLTEDEQKELLKIERDVQSEKDLIPNEQMQIKHKKWL